MTMFDMIHAQGCLQRSCLQHGSGKMIATGIRNPAAEELTSCLKEIPGSAGAGPLALKSSCNISSCFCYSLSNFTGIFRKPHSRCR